MKKMRCAVLTICVSVLLMLGLHPAFASYTDYWNGNPNYPLVWGHMNYAQYLDKSSLNVQRYDPPYYIIAINVVTVHYDDQAYRSDGAAGSMEYKGTTTYRYYYNYDKTGMYVDRKVGTNDWRYLKPTGSNAESGMSMYVGEAAFYEAYHMKFYGAYTWYDSFLKKYIPVFSDNFYENL